MNLARHEATIKRGDCDIVGEGIMPFEYKELPSSFVQRFGALRSLRRCWYAA
jgi:hypothetical protein